MIKNEKGQKFFKDHWRKKSTYEIILAHNKLRTQLKQDSDIAELLEIELEIFEQILTERDVWFPEVF